MAFLRAARKDEVLGAFTRLLVQSHAPVDDDLATYLSALPAPASEAEIRKLSEP